MTDHVTDEGSLDSDWFQPASADRLPAKNMDSFTSEEERERDRAREIERMEKSSRRDEKKKPISEEQK